MEHKEVAVTHSQLPSNLILVFITTYICPHIIIIIGIVITKKRWTLAGLDQFKGPFLTCAMRGCGKRQKIQNKKKTKIKMT